MLALPEDGAAVAAASLVPRPFASETEALQATGAPERHGLVRLEEATDTLHSLTAEGLDHQQAGLPERRAAEALHAAGGRLPMAELPAKAGLKPAEVPVALGWLKRKGWATLEKGTVALTAGRPAAGVDEEVLLGLSAIPQSGREPNAVAQLAARGIVTETVRTRRSIALTPEGRRVRAGIPADEADATEVSQVTPELVARWAAMGRDERARTRLRPFEFDLAVAPQHPGKAHPLTHILTEIRGIFWSMGFAEIAGDYVESAHWNMDALFIPQDHPAREMQDTFYLETPAAMPVSKWELDRAESVHVQGGGTGSTGWGGKFDRAVSQRALLRTHTTNTTIRYLAQAFNRPEPKPVHKVFGLGRVFRKETMDATHLPEFTQIEGIVVEPGATFNTLIGLCKHFFAQMGFPEVRFRPAYFPYTEPSMEIEVFYNGRWMELGGCGVFRPEVTHPIGVRDNVLAWGFGLERLAMMRLGLKDIRDLYVSDLQWLRETPVR
ncbi:MAG: phenylalanyl-tRNA synthetase alpha chain [Thermoplasmata archaeon]|nr:phenylalanyl-tRNA synthetase alpha chain [Thermoplasmata archaeon]